MSTTNEPPDATGTADTYGDEVETIVQGFGYERCDECGGDLGEHVIAPDPLGHAHAWCATDAGTGRETYAQNELDHDRLPTEEGFWTSPYAPTTSDGMTNMSNENKPTSARSRRAEVEARLLDAALRGDADTAAQVAGFLATDRRLADLQAAVTADDTDRAVAAFAHLDDDTQRRVLDKAMNRLVNGDAASDETGNSPVAEADNGCDDTDGW
jgi:hypothetical protein